MLGAAARQLRLLLVAVVCAGASSAAAVGAPPAESDLVFVSAGTVTIASAVRPAASRLPLPGYVTDVAPSHDGSLLAYETVGAPLESSLAVADRRTGQTRWRLGVVPFDRPVWAPAGARFAFSTWKEL